MWPWISTEAKITPKAQISIGKEYETHLISISGAAYHRVVTRLVVAKVSLGKFFAKRVKQKFWLSDKIVELPKSQRAICKAGAAGCLTRMLEGFKSRCTTALL
jgi:hypothetical protein